MLEHVEVQKYNKIKIFIKYAIITYTYLLTTYHFVHAIFYLFFTKCVDRTHTLYD